MLIIHSSLQFMHTTPNSSALITAYMLKSPLTPKLYYKKKKCNNTHTLGKQEQKLPKTRKKEEEKANPFLQLIPSPLRHQKKNRKKRKY